MVGVSVVGVSVVGGAADVGGMVVLRAVVLGQWSVASILTPASQAHSFPIWSWQAHRKELFMWKSLAQMCCTRKPSSWCFLPGLRPCLRGLLESLVV